LVKQQARWSARTSWEAQPVLLRAHTLACVDT